MHAAIEEAILSVRRAQPPPGARPDAAGAGRAAWNCAFCPLTDIAASEDICPAEDGLWAHRSAPQRMD
eukprot:gene10128-15544_t